RQLAQASNGIEKRGAAMFARRRTETHPHICAYFILRNASAQIVHGAEFRLGPSVPLNGRLSIVHDCRCIILWNALPFYVHVTESQLSVGVSLINSFSIPLNRIFKTLGHTKAVLI